MEIMIVWWIFVAIYLAPSIIAGLRGHNSAAGIFVTNFAFGWSVIGWLIALIWALNSNTRHAVRKVQVVNTVSAPAPIPAPAANSPPRDWTDRLDDFCFEKFGWK